MKPSTGNGSGVVFKNGKMTINGGHECKNWRTSVFTDVRISDSATKLYVNFLNIIPTFVLHCS